MTYASSSRSVDGFSVSKSISISSGFESLSDGSRDWMMCTTRPSLSPVTQVTTDTGRPHTCCANSSSLTELVFFRASTLLPNAARIYNLHADQPHLNSFSLLLSTPNCSNSWIIPTWHFHCFMEWDFPFHRKIRITSNISPGFVQKIVWFSKFSKKKLRIFKSFQGDF